MTALLEKAMDRVSALSPKKQNALAHLLLDEIDADARWDKAFESSQDELSELAEKAIAKHRQGKTKALDLSHEF
jgi:replicative DNA helicase